MKSFISPQGYVTKLGVYETQSAIGKLKRVFEDNLSAELNLKRVSAPLFVLPESGLNDDLNGVERAVQFSIKNMSAEAQVVHSLAKWKRMALHNYEFPVGEGIYTDMNAIRRDEDMDNTHSIYVDQWDWEKVIDASTRNMDTLTTTVNKIVEAICDTLDEMKKTYSTLDLELSRKVAYITTQELEDLYPDLTPKERENAYTKEHGTVFLMQIGDVLKSGERHDGRAPDYDDWAMNGDILFWNELLGMAFEVSSMGIRVDAQSLDSQLKKANCDDRRCLDFHKKLLANELPLTIGGGIGQSRLCMLLLQKAHIGEVQVSVWDSNTCENAKLASVKLL